MKYDNNYWKSNWTIKPKYPMFIVKRITKNKIQYKLFDNIDNRLMLLLVVLAYVCLM